MKTGCSLCTLSFLVALVAGCGGSSPSEESQGGALGGPPGGGDDRGLIRADPNSADSMRGSRSAADWIVSSGDAGAPSEAWVGFRLPFSSSIAPTLLVVTDADGGGE